jgi:transcriptional antiterminator RfaH
MLEKPHSNDGHFICLNGDAAKWYVAYTFPKAENKVKSKLEMLGIHSYLPLHQVIRNWSDRKKKLNMPLFPNYIFILTTVNKRQETFAIKEIVRYISFEGKPATIKESIIHSLEKILRGNIEINIEQAIEVGSPVRIVHGPFAGVEGILSRRNGKTRLIVRIDVLQRSIGINISINDVISLCSDSTNINHNSISR